jgi:integrase
MKDPKTLKQLLRTAAHPLWKGKAYERTAYRNVEEFIEVVGDLSLSEVKTVTMDVWKKNQEGRVSDATINRKLVNIKQVLRFAVDRDWMVKMPVAKGKPESEGRVRWLSPQEEQQMFALFTEWEETEVARFVRVLIETGMRRGELLSLKPSQIDGPWIRLWVTKTKKARSVPLTEGARQALEGFRGWSIDTDDLRRVWTKLRASMGLTEDVDFVLHSLRHTAATRLLAKTGDVTKVQRLLGHKKLQTTMRYSHIADDDLLNAVCSK